MKLRIVSAKIDSCVAIVGWITTSQTCPRQTGLQPQRNKETPGFSVSACLVPLIFLLASSPPLQPCLPNPFQLVSWLHHYPASLMLSSASLPALPTLWSGHNMNPADQESGLVPVKQANTQQGILLGQHDNSIRALIEANQTLTHLVSTLSTQLASVLSLQSPVAPSTSPNQPSPGDNQRRDLYDVPPEPFSDDEAVAAHASCVWHGVLCVSHQGYTSLVQPQECKKAQYVPGYNLGGEGFDIVTMERKGAYVIDTETWDLGNGTCRLYRNSYMNNDNQKVPVAVVDWRTLPKCSLKVSSVVYDSVETLVNDSTSSVTNDWKVDGLEIPVDPSVTVGVGLGGSHSRDANFGMKKSKKDRYNFFRHSVYCTFYNRASIKAMYKHCQEEKKKLNSMQSFSSAFNERTTEVIGGDIEGADILFQGQSDPSVYTNWLKSLKNTPDVVRYNINPLHTILPKDHAAKAGLKQEVEKYILEKCSVEEMLRKLIFMVMSGLKTDGSVEVTYGDQNKRTAIISNNDNPK
ncbi:hypothetical protein L3Q82_005228 [Scortum barcoo]|uniref:Uncharacterized protein n=1 Tax=Scortum barcoo TaxID=214431 RepID=A0ACB8V9L0_9TELE|nr:hypothetical protein L3Q82_005228 [Scortum barcoo]